MPNFKVTDLPAATLPLAGDEPIMVVQAGQSRQTTVGEIAPSAVAEYLVLTPSGVLAEERIFTPSPGQLVGADGGPGNPYTLSIDPAFFNGFANPSALVGLAAVNGVAVTAMRSDASPALDQNIAPTWTGQHQWTQVLLGPDGAVGAPAFSFVTDPNTGLYSTGPDALGLATNGVLRLTVNTADIVSTLPYWAPDGSAAAPAFAFSAGGTTGFYRVGAGDIGLATSGVLRWDVSTTAITSTLQRLGQAGAVGAPAYSFSADPNTGMYQIGADSLGFAANGALQLTVNVGDVRSSGTLGAGDVTIPGMSSADLYAAINSGNPSVWMWEGDAAADTKLWRIAAGGGVLSLSSRTDLNGAGANVWTVTRTGTVINAFNVSAAQLLASDGLVGTPGIGFISDPDCGLYRIGANNIGIATAGAKVLDLSATGTASVPPFLGPAGAVGAPSFSFSADPNTGFYNIGADNIGVSLGGVKYWDWGTVTATWGAAVTGGLTLGAANTATADGDTARLLATANATNFAIFAANAATTTPIIGSGPTGAQAVLRTLGSYPIVFGTNNTYRGKIDATGVILWTAGAVGAPAFSFDGDPNTGIYSNAADDLAITAGGVKIVDFQTAGGLGQILGIAGTVGAPVFSFGGDSDTGMYSVGANAIGFATAGTLRVQIGSAGFFLPIIGTTASAANAFIDNATSPVNSVLRVTSSLRYKQDVQDLDPAKIDLLLKLRPVTYRSKSEADDQSLRWYGFIAEEVAEIEPRLVQWTKDKDEKLIPDGMQYERLTVLMVAYIKKLEERVKVLEKRVH